MTAEPTLTAAALTLTAAVLTSPAAALTLTAAALTSPAAALTLAAAVQLSDPLGTAADEVPRLVGVVARDDQRIAIASHRLDAARSDVRAAQRCMHTRHTCTVTAKYTHNFAANTDTGI